MGLVKQRALHRVVTRSIGCYRAHRHCEVISLLAFRSFASNLEQADCNVLLSFIIWERFHSSLKFILFVKVANLIITCSATRSLQISPLIALNMCLSGNCHCTNQSLIVLSAAAESLMVMEAESKQLECVTAIKFTISDSQGTFICLSLKNSKAFSCTMRNPESELAVVQLLGWTDRFPVCL